MGQSHSSGGFFHEASVKDHFGAVQTLWGEDDLSGLLERLKDMTLNFSLDKIKFGKLMRLSSTYEDLVAKWFEEFSHDRASQVVDGLEFLSASIMISSKVPLFRKICLLFNLFDLDKTACIRKDEFTIFLKAVTTGLHRMVIGLPPPASVLDLGSHSAEFFATLSSHVLSRQDFLMWMTEAHFALHYLSVLSKLGTTIFAWGGNHRFQLGLNLEPKLQRLPSPVLTLESAVITFIASNESHSLFLTSEGRVWSCGSGFCGILGHGGVADSPQPRVIESLAHTTIVDVAVGVRHSVAVSDKGQVFTWGAADLYQLGHGSIDDKEVYEYAYDAKTGGTFAYISKPTVVMALFGKKIVGRRVSCCNFTTVVLTDLGRLYTWGNNTDGQCAQGQRCNDHVLVYVDPHMQRTAMQAIMVPKLVEVNAVFEAVACGGYHVLAIDQERRLWTWGQGMWGKLGHCDQRSMYEPKLVESMKHRVTQDIAAGESHSLCLISLYRLTVTGSSTSTPLSPFSLLGLPLGRPDRHIGRRQTVTPPNTSLQLNAFASARLLQIGVPFRFDPAVPIVNPELHSHADIQESVVLIDRGVWEGEWLKLATTDFDFRIVTAAGAGSIPAKTDINGQLALCMEGKWEVDTDLEDLICVFEVVVAVDPLPNCDQKAVQEELSPTISQLARECQTGGGLACLCILPNNVEPFSLQVPEELQADVKSLPIGVMSYQHGLTLKAHVMRLINMRIAESVDGVPEEVRNWKERREEFTGRPFYENTTTGKKRRAPPMIFPRTDAQLIKVREDTFLQRLKAMIDLRPKGIVVSQQSWRPDVGLVNMPDSMFDLETLDVPIVQVTYEAGEELKSVFANGSHPWVTMEVQPYGGVCAWGNGTVGQLGLTGIENQIFLTKTQNTLTQEENSYTCDPCYVAHIHEHQVVSIACGAVHTLAVTQQGEVFAWGSAVGLGVPLDKPTSGVPVFVEQLEGLVRATKAFAGYNHSFVAADMPFNPVV
eukprot:TRINITY_DN33485_c0_g1_i1.p1 TRINITY_DN33485_c0_g1~~TRINITY_DN33485_c0_g1_i1.p1  ORF type:complete len:992 (-),score=137.00 TRINITY_DN33485_c0_g1_i1:153-3128(-)